MTLLTKKTINSVLKHYSLGKLKSFNHIPLGISSENYKLQTTTGIFVLKKHRIGTNVRIGSIEKIQTFFASHNIPVVCPIANNQGTLHVIENNFCYVIYPFVSGTGFEAGQQLPDAYLAEMGSMLAQMHLLTKHGIVGDYSDISKLFLPKDPRTYISKIDEILEIISNIKNKSTYDKNAAKGLMFKKKLFLENLASRKKFSIKKYHLGHSDFHSGNVFFNDQGKISAIFDFDTSGPMPRIYDLVTAIMHTCLGSSYTKSRIRKAKIFLNAYSKRYPFSKTELKQAIDLFYEKSISLWQEKDHYINHNFRGDEHYTWAIRGIRYLYKHRNELCEKLYPNKVQ